MQCQLFEVVALDAMDSSGEQHLQMDHNIYKRRLDVNGEPIEEPKREDISVKSTNSTDVNITFDFMNETQNFPPTFHDEHF